MSFFILLRLPFAQYYMKAEKKERNSRDKSGGDARALLLQGYQSEDLEVDPLRDEYWTVYQKVWKDGLCVFGL